MDVEKSTRILVVTHAFQIEFLPTDFVGIVATHPNVSQEAIRARMKAHHPNQQYIVVDSTKTNDPEALTILAKKSCVLIFAFYEMMEGKIRYWWQKDKSIYAHALITGVHEVYMIRTLIEGQGKGCLTAIWVSTYELVLRVKNMLGNISVPIIEVRFFHDNVKMVEKKQDIIKPVVRKHRKIAVQPQLHYGSFVAKAHVIWNREHLWAKHRNNRLSLWQFVSEAFTRISPSRYDRVPEHLHAVDHNSLTWSKTPIVRLKSIPSLAMQQILKRPVVACTTTSLEMVKRLLPMLGRLGIMARAIHYSRLRKDLEATIIQCMTTMLQDNGYHRMVIVIMMDEQIRIMPSEGRLKQEPDMLCPDQESAIGLRDLCKCFQMSFKVAVGDRLTLDAEFIRQTDLISPAFSSFILAATRCIPGEIPANMTKSVGVFDFRWTQAEPLSVILSFLHRWVKKRRRERGKEGFKEKPALSAFQCRLEMSVAHCILYRPAEEMIIYASTNPDPPGRFPRLEGIPPFQKVKIFALLVFGILHFTLAAKFQNADGTNATLEINASTYGDMAVTWKVYTMNGLLGTFTALSTWLVIDSVRTMFSIWVGDRMVKNGASVWSWLTSVGMRLVERVTLLRHCDNSDTRRAASISLWIWAALALFDVLGRTVLIAQASKDERISITVNPLGCDMIAAACLVSALILVCQGFYYDHCWWWDGSLWQIISTSQVTASGPLCIVRGGCASGAWWTFAGRVIAFRDVQRTQNVGHLHLQVFESRDDPRLTVNWPAELPARCFCGNPRQSQEPKLKES